MTSSSLSAAVNEPVKIVEVGPRDGLQNEDPVPTEAKVRLLDALAGRGIARAATAASFSATGSQATFGLTGADLPDGAYRVRVVGSTVGGIRDSRGNPLYGKFTGTFRKASKSSTK